jgi:hypothetical protein
VFGAFDRAVLINSVPKPEFSVDASPLRASRHSSTQSSFSQRHDNVTGPSPFASAPYFMALVLSS